ncbi:MAG: porin [Rhodocyclaceae bacterium]|nr:porin [Rhodocyclaceae bacterium]
MQKKLIALAVAGLSTAAFAQTNVTIYGVADVSVQGQNVSKGVASTATSAQGSVASVKSNSSGIGFKGTEDLGNGLKGLFQIETNVNLNGNGAGTTSVNNGTTFGSMRDSYIGVSSKYGTGMAGYLSTPYRSTLTSFDVMPGATGDGRIETIFGRTTVGSSSLQAGTTTNQSASIRATAMAYALPTMYGFNGSIAYAPNANNNNSIGAENQNTGAPNSALSLALGWEGYGVAVKGAFQQAKYTSAVDNSSTAGGFQSGYPLQNATNYLIGAQYTGLPGLKAGVVYGRNTLGMNSTATTGAAKGANNSVWAGVSYRFGNNEPRLSYANTSDTSGLAQASTYTGQNGGNQWNLGWGYYLSKRTQVYGIVSQIKNNANANYNYMAPTGVSLSGGEKLFTYGMGMRTNF